MLTLVHGGRNVDISNPIYDKIRTFLNRKSLDGGSQIAYEIDVKQFFSVTRNKELDQLTLADLQYKLSEVESFRLFLSNELGYRNCTINRKMCAIRGIMERLKQDDLDINISAFYVDKLPEIDSEGYDILHYQEVQQIIELAWNGAVPNGKEKALLIELAAVTSFRLNSLLLLTPKHFVNIDGVWVVKLKAREEKTKKEDAKAIKNGLYDRLKENLFMGTNDRIFTMSDRTALRAIKTLAAMLPLGEDKNVVFHSLKACGIEEVWCATGGDFMKTAKQGNHASFATTYKYYMKFSEDYANSPSLLIGQNVDLSPLQSMTKEELLGLIAQLDKGTQYKMLEIVKDGKYDVKNGVDIYAHAKI